MRAGASLNLCRGQLYSRGTRDGSMEEFPTQFNARSGRAQSTPLNEGPIVTVHIRACMTIGTGLRNVDIDVVGLNHKESATEIKHSPAASEAR